MRVVCLEGSHGCGKTKLINKLKKLGYNILDEGFLDMPEFSLHP
jgi:dephospho-CoA kinase